MDNVPEDKDNNFEGSQESNEDFLVVGIGASAGGIQALKRFFKEMPEKPGMAFVVILHLSAEHESHLAEVLQGVTYISVRQVTENIKIEPDQVYVIPPNKHLSISDGYIQLLEPIKEHGRRSPIDLFFRALAHSYGKNAASIVLSGTGSDGTLGIQRVKEYGGITIVQDPQEAEHMEMPSSAIKTNLVDYIVPVNQMPIKLITYWQNRCKIHLPYEEIPPRKTEEDSLREVLALLRARTGHDFTNYKRGTLLRRLARRLQVNNADDLSSYLNLLREQPSEIQMLLRDLLISVTNFFRDQEAFQSLELDVIPRLFQNKSADDPVRVWVAGCATGEEAYSISLLLREYQTKNIHSTDFQVFATDIDELAINVARAGLYPETISVDVSVERLRRFFGKDQGQFRVKKDIRESVLFAAHNLLRDPPFSRMDLISCRNLLIYLNRDVQNRVLELFHFALRPDGYLFLGNSESVDSMPGLFTTVDKKHRIFKRISVAPMARFIPVMPIAGVWGKKALQASTIIGQHKTLSWDQLHQQLLEQYAPPSVLINEDYDIVHLSEQVGRYLRLTGGEPTLNLLKVVHPDLRLELRSALFSAMQRGNESESRRTQVQIDGERREITLIVRSVQHPASVRGLLLVVFNEKETPVENSKTNADKDAGSEPIIRQLEEEVQRTREQLRTTIEQYETSTEELKASNEELQAMNEELHSTTEELETSKEELQAVNEELTTVNQEMKSRIEEISRINSDLQNLMVSTNIGTIFLDRDLCIKRYTPNIQDLFNVIPSDTGRPITHLTHNLNYEYLFEDAKMVLEKLNVIEREAQGTDGRWYLLCFLPYRTLDDRIDGVVLTFLDITERKRAEQALRESEEYLKLLIESAKDFAIFTMDKEGCVNSWNAGAERIFGYKETEIIGRPGGILFLPEDRERGIPEDEFGRAIKDGRAVDERYHLRKDGTHFYASGVMSLMQDGEFHGYVKILRDLTEKRQADEILRNAHKELEQKVEERTSELAKINKNLHEEIVERRRAEEQRRYLLRQLITAQEEERSRISRELHDQMGQHISALLFGLKTLKDKVGNNDSLTGQFERLQKIAQELDHEIDNLASELRPPSLDLGLHNALLQNIQGWKDFSKIDVDFHSVGLEQLKLSSYIESTIYRVVQEALNNIHKHSQAKQVGIILEHRGDDVIVIVENDGPGFDVEAVTQLSHRSRKLGLVGMQERVKLVGGTFNIESSESGTTIFIRIPISMDEVKGGEE